MRNKNIKNIHTVPGVSITLFAVEKTTIAIKKIFYFLTKKEK